MRCIFTTLFFLTASISIPSAWAQKKPAKPAEVKVQKTSLTRDQETQLGKDAASQVEKEMEVVKNPEVEAWLNRIGQQLAKTPQANAYPYYFKLVNEDSINAFALPGGPMFVHTGLIKAADNEGEVAGVLAHEMSHVALRHGAAQMSKQQTWGSVFGALGAAGGILGGGASGQCSLICQAAQMGAGLGQNSLLMKFSRGYEHDADLNGARMMNSASYDPIGLPSFFEKLQSQMGKAGEPKGLALFMASHPATGSRIEYVQQDLQFYEKKGTYTADTGQFARIKQLVAGIPPAKLKPAALLSVVQGNPRANLPQGYKDYAAKGFSIAYPASWQAGQPQQGSSVYMVPQGGVTQMQSGATELVSGVMVDYYVPDKGADSTTLEGSTSEFVDALKKGDSNLRAERPVPFNLGGRPAMTVKLFTKTSTGVDQIVYIASSVRQAGLWYMVMAVPTQQQGLLDPAFQQMMSTVTFPSDVP